MCGIAGFSLSPQANVNAKKLAKAMLLDIESRGKDATGFAYVDKTGKFQVHKSDVDATKFVRRNLCLDKSATAVILHTRWATQGRPEYNVNNHPIATGDIVGVHNGCISNDDELFAEMTKVLEIESPRIGQVDSEAIFSALNYYTCDPKKVLEAVQGSAAVAWLDNADEKPGTLHLARLNSSPLVLAECADGSLLFASTQSAVMAGANAAFLVVEKIRNIAEGSYITVVDGAYTTVDSFTPAVYVSKYSGSSYYSKVSDKRSVRAYSWDDYDYLDTGAIQRSTPQTVIGKPIATEYKSTDLMTPAEREAYQLWWRRNLRTVEEDAKRDKFVDALADDAKEQTIAEQARQARFQAFLNAPKVNAFYILDPQATFPEPTEMEYLIDPKNVEREYAIEKWCNECKTNEVDKTRVALSMMAHVRPGYAVTTDVDGIQVNGVLVSLPTTFPGGDFIIRAYVPRKRRPNGFEAVFVARHYWEFDLTAKKHANLTLVDTKESTNA